MCVHACMRACVRACVCASVLFFVGDQIMCAPYSVLNNLIFVGLFGCMEFFFTQLLTPCVSQTLCATSLPDAAFGTFIL